MIERGKERKRERERGKESDRLREREREIPSLSLLLDVGYF